MSTINDGGPAFPAFINSPSGLVFDALQPGMTLRDYFAGQALAMLADPNFNESWEQTAERAYKLADRMLAAREAKK